jgi:hypothetical protein
MNTNRLLLLLLLLVPWLANSSFAEPIPVRASFVSPNGRYCVQLEEIDRLPHFVIKDLETGQTDDSIVMPTLVLYLHWAANSRAFVTVEHIAKGSYGRVVYLTGDKWNDVEVGPPLEGKKDAMVTKLQLGTDTIHYKFAVTKLAPNLAPIDYSFCDLDVSLVTGKVSSVKWTHISEAEWAAAPGPDNPVCLPAMQRERYYRVCK